MDEPQRHCPNWNKSDTKWEIYYSTYMRHLEQVTFWRENSFSRGRIVGVLGSYWLIDTEFVRDNWNFLELDRGDSCTTPGMYLVSLECTLNMVKIKKLKINLICSIPNQSGTVPSTIFYQGVCKYVVTFQQRKLGSLILEDWFCWTSRLPCFTIINKLCNCKAVTVFQVQTNSCPFFFLSSWASELCCRLQASSSLLPEKPFRMKKTWSGALPPSLCCWFSAIYSASCCILPFTAGWLCSSADFDSCEAGDYRLSVSPVSPEFNLDSNG